MDKREKVARAIARSGLIPASREWKELLPETRDHYMQQADAAIAALEPVTVQEAAQVLLDAESSREAQIAVYAACEGRVKVYKFMSALRALIEKDQTNG